MHDKDLSLSPSAAVLTDLISVVGRQAVTAAVPQAASAGMWALSQGGNAFDAALAACFVETIALPMKCGLAGDLVALVSVQGEPLRALVSVGAAPSALAEGLKLERLGPCSVGVPGAPDGYAHLHAFANLSLSQLIMPAVSAAERGVPWGRIGLSYLVEAWELLQQWSPDCVYVRNGMPEEGDLLRLPGLAKMLRAYADLGPALFDGSLGQDVTDFVQNIGGIIRREDLQTRPAKWCDPLVWQDEFGRNVYTTPSPTQGALLLEALANQNAFFGSERPACAATQAALIAHVRDHAQQVGNLASDDGTSVVSAADDAGNMVIIVHSNSYPRFGSGVVLPNGLILNNRPGRGFNLDAAPNSPNAAAAGIVPPTTLHAWGLQDGDKLMLGATPGGVNQLPWNYQLLAQILAGRTAAEAILKPKWAVNEAGGYTVESGLHLETSMEVVNVNYLALRSANQTLLRHKNGSLEAVADPRTGASALAIF